MDKSIQLRDVITGLIKSVAFAKIIAQVSCLEGFRVRGGPDSVGRSTVIVADAVFTAIFYFTVKSLDVKEGTPLNEKSIAKLDRISDQLVALSQR